MTYIPSQSELNVIQNNAQGSYKKVLCVCSVGCLRSPTAARIIQEKFGYNTRSCGLDTKNAIIPYSDKLAFWADEIVCMESHMFHEIEAKMALAGFSRNIVCLRITDDYDYMDGELCSMIENNYKKYRD